MNCKCNLEPSDKILDFVKDYEKLSLTAYLPTPKDKPTIGFGMTMYPDGRPVKMGDKILLEKAISDFKLLFNQFADKVNDLVTSNICQNQADALYSLAYNIGIGGLKTSTVLKLVNKNPKDPKIGDAFKMWNKQAGKVLAGLTKRRQQEADIYLTGIYNSTH